MRFARSLPRGVVAALAAAMVIVVVGVVVVVAGLGSSLHQAVSSNSKPLPAASLQVSGQHHGKFSYGRPLRLRVANGVLSKVTVSQSGLGRLDGRFNKSRTRWHSVSKLIPSSHITAAISYVDLAHHTTTRHIVTRTPAAKHSFTDYISPGGGTVGIGSPVVVSFDKFVPAKRRAAVEAGLSVTTKPSVVGAWHWMSGNVVHWRPPSYWKPGTKVHVSSFLQGVRIGRTTWGPVGHHSASFKIGASHISEADQATHEMRVFDNGTLIHTFPISTGRAQYPTMDGVHIALQKSSVVTMDSATVGIPQGSPGYYNETVYWDVRISNGGEFVHAAPWSVGSQGSTNVSHGCVNLSTANAEWFYNWSQNGDIVDVYNGVRPPESGDAGTADWNMSWKQWLAGDAAPTKAAKKAHPRPAHTYEPGFIPFHHPSHHAKHHAAKHHAAKHHAAKHHAGSVHGSGSGGN
jgi:lipoprotein-anchoring transpeptidase ErfK/SrfK